MENRDKKLVEIRPVLDLSLASEEIEQFQNNTLRPILKLQHDLLIRICQHQFVKRKNVFFGLGALRQLDYIEQQITQDKQFKNLLFGALVAHFTLPEWDFYKKHEQELRKRMTALLTQRAKSDIQALMNR